MRGGRRDRRDGAAALAGAGCTGPATADWVEQEIRKGVCPLTGRRFDLGKVKGRSANPDSPSLNRTDRGSGYHPGNVRVTTWHVNQARGQFGDHYLLQLALGILAMRSERVHAATTHRLEET